MRGNGGPRTATRRPTAAPALVCGGRRYDNYGRPLAGAAGEPHGTRLAPKRGESTAQLELRARVRGWRVESRDDFARRAARAAAAGVGAPERSVMCPTCARPLGQVAS